MCTIVITRLPTIISLFYKRLFKAEYYTRYYIYGVPGRTHNPIINNIVSKNKVMNECILHGIVEREMKVENVQICLKIENFC